ncbi:MAG: HupE/UreJ family protein [Thermoanaerobaculia bacterium]|nr:HupE/UreJ family protein [Thermoanaerobaculia bacterium]
MIHKARSFAGLGIALWLLVCLEPAASFAHSLSDSYLSVAWQGDAIEGRWDIALRDLEFAVGLDADGDLAITWAELRARHDAIAAYALTHLDVKSDGADCTPRVRDQLVDHHVEEAYSVLLFELDCPNDGTVTLDYRLLFDQDPSHRGLLRVRNSDGVETAVLSPSRSSFEVAPRTAGRGAWRQFTHYWREGVWHIWIGFDHVLFLLTLLLPAVLHRDGKSWRAVPSFRPAFLEVVGVVTAFTVAHSLTLGLAVLGWVALPSRWVESAIAATVILAALNNLFPIIEGKRWVIVFFLGLIHGFGFAGVLVDLGLPANALAAALGGFNLGVECGQLVVVALFLPLAFALRDSWLYRRVLFGAGSAAVAAIACLWLLDRGFGLRVPVL